MSFVFQDLVIRGKDKTNPVYLSLSTSSHMTYQVSVSGRLVFRTREFNHLQDAQMTFRKMIEKVEKILQEYEEIFTPGYLKGKRACYTALLYRHGESSIADVMLAAVESMKEENLGRDWFNNFVHDFCADLYIRWTCKN